ncbi:neurotrophin-3 isoform X2 [Ahaetulla prasina]|uniref:neurotrophin-3 isoform X2 n=1 Tax=Ahaetulla prasina TaxID=499056 RepID=UPI00264913BE|nr:neurotrophin-3 isoform X2 [Ahaetulla prasina]
MSKAAAQARGIQTLLLQALFFISSSSSSSPAFGNSPLTRQCCRVTWRRRRQRSPNQMQERHSLKGQRRDQRPPATSCKTLHVNKVMSILFSVTFLAFLCGIQSTSMDQGSLSEDSMNSFLKTLIQAGIWKNKIPKQTARTKDGVPTPVKKTEVEPELTTSQDIRLGFQPVVSLDAELLRQQRRFSSPRVLLSENTPLEPPPLYLMEEPMVLNRTSRRKRYTEGKTHRGEYSVCDSESRWVTDKTSAVDIRGHQVTVLGEIRMGPSPVKQYFYETRCKQAKPAKSGCRGIDDKHWNSQCKTSQTFVRALTSENSKLVAWRWIRIDTSCVCALSRKIGRT